MSTLAHKDYEELKYWDGRTAFNPCFIQQSVRAADALLAELEKSNED